MMTKKMMKALNKKVMINHTETTMMLASLEWEIVNKPRKVEKIWRGFSKVNLNKKNIEYKIYTSNFDEIAVENLEKEEEILRLRKNLDQQLVILKI